MPSPTTADGHGGAGTSDKRQGGLNLRTAVTLLSPDGWLGSNGKDYGPAVRRWEEITGHPAPCPTEAGAKNNRRLSPLFSEWMMGIGPGHVTDIVTDRNDALHVIGNGVVPRQAEAAFRFLMDDSNWSGEVDDSTKQVKPRGKCTGCTFDYQLGTARTGEFKGQLVIRKHNSRTGPGLCSGANKPPAPVHENGCTEETRWGPSACSGCGECRPCLMDPDDCTEHFPPPEGAHTTGCTEETRWGLCAGANQPPESEHGTPPRTNEGHCEQGACTGCCGCSSMCTTDPCGQPGGHPDAYPGDVVTVTPGGIPVFSDPAPLNPPMVLNASDAPLNPEYVKYFQEQQPITIQTPAIVYSDTPHEVVQDPDATNGTLVLPTSWDKGPTPRAGAELDFRHMAAPHPQSMTNGIDAEPTPENVMDKVVQGLRESRYIPLASPIPDPFQAPGAASVIPDGSVSMQPEPDRDRWQRYLIHEQPHTRATTFAKAASSTFTLNEWQQRMTIAGLVLRPDLMALAHGLDVKADRKQLNSIAEQAKEAAGQKVAANLGTAYHAFSERLDAGLITLADVPPQYRPRLEQYTNAVRSHGLVTRPEWIERTVAVRADQVSAALPVAGTLDRIFQLPNGELVIGDLKTGADLSYGWGEIAVQLALYAHGVNTHGLFDWRTKTWETGLKVRTDFAIVMHLPAGGDGCTLHKVDLVKGWQRAQVCGQVMAMQADKGALSHPFTPADVPALPSPEAQDASDAWEHAKTVFRAADSQQRLAELYQFAMDSGKFHTDQLATLVGIGKDRLAVLAGEPPF